MDDLQAKVLGTVKQLKEADLTAISNATGIAANILKGVCNYLTRYGYLAESGGKYKVSLKGTRALYEEERWIKL